MAVFQRADFAGTRRRHQFVPVLTWPGSADGAVYFTAETEVSGVLETTTAFSRLMMKLGGGGRGGGGEFGFVCRFERVI